MKIGPEMVQLDRAVALHGIVQVGLARPLLTSLGGGGGGGGSLWGCSAIAELAVTTALENC